jgi:hypothetical protein
VAAIKLLSMASHPCVIGEPSGLQTVTSTLVMRESLEGGLWVPLRLA